TPGSPPFYEAPLPTGIIRYEEDHPALLYNGVPIRQTATSWVTSNAVRASRGYVYYSQTANDTVTLDFEGTWIGVGFLTASNAGMAEIFIDGVSRGVVDTYNSSARTLSLYYDDLVPGSHTLTIHILGMRNPSSSANRVHLDYIDVWDGTPLPDGTFEATTAFDENPRLHQSTNWSQINHATASEGSYIRAGSNVWFPFTGDSVAFQAFGYSSAGQVEILVDGQQHGILTLTSSTVVTHSVSAFDLGPGPHVLQIQAFQGTATVDNFTTPGRLPLVEMTPPTAEIPIQSGDSLTYTLLLANRGTRTDTVDLALSGNTWPASLSDSSVTVEPGVTTAVAVVLSVPASTPVGSSDMVTVTAVSTVYPEQTAVSTLTTRVVNLRVQLCLALDGSGSISGSEWLLMTGGIANAVRDSSIMSWNGSVELSIVQFGSSQARTELEPVIILGETTAQAVADQIEAIPQIGGNTPMAAGVDQCTALITGSPYFTAASKRVINVPNDGMPNVGSPDGLTAAVNARIAAVEAGVHEVNAEGIGISDSNFAWLRDEFVYPQPGYEAPPFIPGRGGFAVRVNSFAEFEESIREKVRFVTHVSYGLEVDHRVPLTNAVVLTNTITPDPAVTGIDGDEAVVGWQYVLTEDEPLQLHNLQLQLEGMEPGEVRQVASGTWVSYTVAGGSNLLALPPLYVTAAHLVAIEPPLQTVSLGGSAVYQVELFNPGTADLTLDLSVVGLPAGWAELAGSAIVPASGSLTLPLTVTTPAIGELGDYPFAVAVTTGSGGHDQAGAVLRVDSPAEQFAITVAPKYAAVPNGATITYTVTITNLETAGQSYALTWTGLADSVVELPPSVSVPGGGAVTVPLVIIAAGSHGPHPFAVTATSLGSGTARSDDAVMAVIGDRRVAASLAPPAAVGGPGTETPYTLTVTNTGSVFDTYDISANLPDGWSYRLDANGQEVDSLALNAFLFNAADLRLVITPADDALPGDYTFTVTVQSQSNPNVRATTGGILTVLPYGVRVQLLPAELVMSPADSGSWQVIVTNTGSTADTYDLSANGIIQAVAQFSPATVSLAPGQSQTVQMSAGGMTFALPTSYAIGVTAHSQSDGRIQASDDGLLTFTGYEAVEARWHPASQTISDTLTASYMLVITNTGNVGTIFDVVVTAPDLTADLQVEQLYIPARMVAGVLVTVAASEAGSYTIHGAVTAVSGAVTADDTAILIVQLANQPPVVDAGPDQTTDEGTAISFAGTVTHPDNLDFTVAWDFGDGNGAGNILTPTHTYLDDGIYLVTLTATDSNGLSSSDTLTVTVYNVAPIVDAGPDQTVDEGETVSFSGSFTDPGVLDTHEIVWDFGDGQSAADSLAVSHVYETAGVYTVTLTVTDNAGDAGSDTLLVTVLAQANNPPVAVDDEATAVQETPLVIDVLANDFDPDGDELTIVAVTQPANGMVVINNGETITYTPAAGFYGTTDSFTYTISDGRGGVDTATVVVTVVPAGVCTELYPIALHIDTLLAVNIGDVINDIYNGSDSGQFGWLSWTGDPSVGALVNSLTPPGDSYTYINPYDPGDNEVSTGDWVFGAPGVSNSGNVRQALNNLKTMDITVPVWNASEMSGSNTNYHVAGFAVVRLLDYQLPNQNRISVHFKGFAANCGDILVSVPGQPSLADTP
ncbi:MAG: PKD domain-containing protein, partial [Chloroflexota bacterium]